MEINLSAEEIYEYELKCHQAMAVCDLAFKAFVVQDFSERTMSLKVQSYYYSSLISLTFSEFLVLILAKLLQFCLSLWQELLW